MVLEPLTLWVELLTAATAAGPELVTMFVSGYTDALFVAHPPATTDG